MATLHLCLLILAGILGSLARTDPQGQRNDLMHHSLNQQAFIFPEGLSTNFVQVEPNVTGNLDSFTACLWVHSDESKPYALFSYARQDSSPDIVLSYHDRYTYKLLIQGAIFDFKVQGKGYASSGMDHICCSWEKKSGVVAFWKNGQPCARQGTQKKPLNPNCHIILGQQQVSSRDTFENNMALQGEIEGFGMWDRELTHEEVCRVYKRQPVRDAIVSWERLTYTAHGDVTVAPSISQACIPSLSWHPRAQCSGSPCGCQGAQAYPCQGRDTQ